MLHETAGLLLSAVGGYWVLERSQAHKGNLKKIGQVLGTLVMIISFAGVVCKVWYAVACQSGLCPLGKGKSYMCPFSGKSMTTSPVYSK